MGSASSTQAQDHSPMDYGPAAEDCYTADQLHTAQDRVAGAREISGAYHDANDVFLKMGMKTYSRQVPPIPPDHWRSPEDRASENTMILVGVSRSMNHYPSVPVYHEGSFMYWMKAPQPEGKVLARAIMRRFVAIMSHHDSRSIGYDLVTTSSEKMAYVGATNETNFDALWKMIEFSGGEHTHVMPGWREVKRRHLKKWEEQQTPFLRLLVFLDAIPKDISLFEKDTLETPWAMITIFLSGAGGSLIHHCGAIRLGEMHAKNPRTTIVCAEGQIAERYVVHELLKRHLSSELSLKEFKELEKVL